MPVYPMGMALVAASLKEEGYDVKQLDPVAQQEEMQALSQATAAGYRPLA